MKVLLLVNVKGLGQKGDVIETSEGHFRNFLLPRRLAALATNTQVAHVKAQKAKAVEKLENLKESAMSIKERVHGKTLELKEKASPTGKLYAAVSTKEVAELIKNQLKVEVPVKHIHMDTIKEAGQYKAVLDLYKDITAEVSLNVAAE